MFISSDISIDVFLQPFFEKQSPDLKQSSLSRLTAINDLIASFRAKQPIPSNVLKALLNKAHKDSSPVVRDALYAKLASIHTQVTKDQFERAEITEILIEPVKNACAEDEAISMETINVIFGIIIDWWPEKQIKSLHDECLCQLQAAIAQAVGVVISQEFISKHHGSDMLSQILESALVLLVIGTISSAEEREYTRECVSNANIATSLLELLRKPTIEISPQQFNTNRDYREAVYLSELTYVQEGLLSSSAVSNIVLILDELRQYDEYYIQLTHDSLFNAIIGLFHQDPTPRAQNALFSLFTTVFCGELKESNDDIDSDVVKQENEMFLRIIAHEKLLQFALPPHTNRTDPPVAFFTTFLDLCTSGSSPSSSLSFEPYLVAVLLNQAQECQFFDKMLRLVQFAVRYDWQHSTRDEFFTRVLQFFDELSEKQVSVRTSPESALQTNLNEFNYPYSLSADGSEANVIFPDLSHSKALWKQEFDKLLRGEEDLNDDDLNDDDLNDGDLNDGDLNEDQDEDYEEDCCDGDY